VNNKSDERIKVVVEFFIIFFWQYYGFMTKNLFNNLLNTLIKEL